jgi:hypothetical protein
VARGSYSIQTISQSVELVLAGGSSLRGVTKILEIVSRSCGFNRFVPHWTTVRTWLLRIGLSQLKLLAESADDWVWLVDCSIQIGVRKCLIVVGFRLSQIGDRRCLTYRDLRLIDLQVLESATKHDIAQHLNNAVGKQPKPIAIVSDHGADLLGAIKLLQEKHCDIREFYDLKHKAACLLKACLAKDDSWQAFQTALGQSKCKTQQTLLAYASAPSQRSKARFMNIEPLVRWGKMILHQLEHCRSKTKIEQQQAFVEHFQWILPFRESIQRWDEWLQVINESLRLTRTGLSTSTVSQLTDAFQKFSLGNPIADQILKFLMEEATKLHADEKMQISTEILESLFGKLKYLERTQEKSGFTPLVLTLGAMLGPSEPDELKTALESTRVRDVINWGKQMLGTTVQAARKTLYQSFSRNNNGQNQIALAS